MAYVYKHIRKDNNEIFYIWLMKEARKHIQDGDFAKWKAEMVVKLMSRL